MPDMVVRTNALTRDFKSTRAVDALTLQVPRGIVFGFLGPNGSGKTTTIRMLLGVVEPTSGSASVLGFDTATKSDEIRSRCGSLLEYPGLYERLSAEDNLELYGRIYRMPESVRRTRIKDLLGIFGLWDRRKDTAGTWSRGMKQKLAIARAVFHRPELVFLDEPTAGLDPVAAVELREQLTDLVVHEGVTVFLTTHNLAEAEKLCARVAVIRQGRLLAEGRPDELRAQRKGRRIAILAGDIGRDALAPLEGGPDVRAVTVEQGRTTLVLQEEARVSRLAARLAAQNIEIDEVRKDEASLEEVFVDLVEGGRE
jgi:ABC-2 type transport system ATP-binding protein